MNTQILNFKKLEVVGATKEEALAKAPFSIMGDATQKFKNWKESQTGGITDNAIKEFCLEYLTKKSKNVPGVGFSITIDAAVADTRERPYKIEDVKNEKGKRKYSTVYQLVNDRTGEIIVEVEGTKAKAKEVARKLYVDGLKDDSTCTYMKQVTEGEPVAFKCKYTPSKASHAGTYLVFGVEA